MELKLTLNGKAVTADVAPDTLLLDFVRAQGCLSVKRGCETANRREKEFFFKNTAKIWKQPKCPSKDEQIKNM